MYPAGDPIIQTLKFLMDQDLHNLFKHVYFNIFFNISMICSDNAM